MASATIGDTRDAIDSVLRDRGQPFSGYSCKTISWDDVSRGTVGGGVSCWGANITDTYLTGKDGTSLYTVRPGNWNEKLGVVRAEDIALLYGNCEQGDGDSTLKNITLKQFLQNPSESGAKYTGIDSDVCLYSAEADKKVSVRFQTVFLPLSSNHSSLPTFQFSTEAYNYNTMSDFDPRNLILLATTQGLAVQADGAGRKRLLLHALDPSTSNIMEYWLEAERSMHRVGGEQKETAKEREDALRRGKAIADTLGLKVMGKRFNTLMTIQIPLVVQQPRFTPSSFGNTLCFSTPSLFGNTSCFSTPSLFGNTSYSFSASTVSAERLCAHRTQKQMAGTSNAARVSRGDAHRVYTGGSVKSPKRCDKEHVTVTIVFYNTVIGGVPTAEDVVAAIEDMENLYTACSESGRLADAAFDFMKKELTLNDVLNIATKLNVQPPI